MALFIYIDGVDRAASVRLMGNSPTGESFHTESAAMAGTVSSGLIEVHDPTGVLDIRGWRPAYIVESVATPDRIWTGFIANVDQTAGPFKNGAGRVHQCETVDLNWHLTRIKMGSGWKRPAETDLARVTALLASTALSGRVYTGALTDLTNNPVNLGEADFTDSFPIDVLTDLLPVAGKTAYVTWDYTNARPQLFYDLTNSTTYDASASISDVLADALASPTTVFGPRVAPVLHRVIEDGYSDVWLRYKNGLVHVHDDAFESSYARRDLMLDTSRIGNPATALAYANKALAAHNHETKTIDCEVELDAEYVNDILEGNRLAFKSSHLTGFTTSTYTRVEKRTVRQVDNNDRRYVLGLQLSDRILSALAGGPPTDQFPNPSSAAPSYKEAASAQANPSSSNTQTVTFAATTAATDVIVAVANIQRSGTGDLAFGWPSGFTPIAPTPVANDNQDHWEVAIATGVTISSFTVTSAITSERFIVGAVVVAGGAYERIAIDTTNVGTTIDVPPVTPDAGNTAVLVAFNLARQGQNMTGNPTGYTFRLDGLSDTGGNSTRLDFWTKTVNPTTGSYGGPGVAATYAAAVDVRAFHVVVSGGAAASPPQPGQEVPWAVVTMSTVGGVSTGTTAYPYADGSLKVKVDGILISPASYTETDPATGAFALTWIKDADEVVTVTYLGR